MGDFNDFQLVRKKFDEDTLRINITKQGGRFTGNLSLLKFRDKDTRQIIVFIPSLDLTGYGSTEEKALEMIKFSVKDYFEFLIHSSTKQRNAELANLGWKHKSLRNKEYSKTFVDINGELKNFNAVGDEVELLTLQA